MESKEQCVMCGATKGKPHHDPDAGRQIVTLHRSKYSKRPGKVCIICRQGLYDMAMRERIHRKATELLASIAENPQ